MTKVFVGVIFIATIALTFAGVKAIVSPVVTDLKGQIEAVEKERDAAIAQLRSIRAKLKEVCDVWAEGEKK